MVDVWLSPGCHIEPAIESIIWLRSVLHFWICYLYILKQCTERQTHGKKNKTNHHNRCPFNERRRKKNMHAMNNESIFVCQLQQFSWDFELAQIHWQIDLWLHLPVTWQHRRINRRLMTWKISCLPVTLLPLDSYVCLLCIQSSRNFGNLLNQFNAMTLCCTDWKEKNKQQHQTILQIYANFHHSTSISS